MHNKDPKSILPQRGINWIINSLLHLAWIIKKSKGSTGWIPLQRNTSRPRPMAYEKQYSIRPSCRAHDKLCERSLKAYHNNSWPWGINTGFFNTAMLQVQYVVCLLPFHADKACYSRSKPATSLLGWHLVGRESQLPAYLKHISGDYHTGFKSKKDTLNENRLGFLCNEPHSLFKFLFVI